MNENATNVPARQEYVFERVMNAPRDLVFAAYTQVEHLKNWWGPKGMPITVHGFDLRPGGAFFYSMAVPGGGDSFGKLVYREIAAPERLSFVVSFTDPEGNPIRHPMADKWPLEVLCTATFLEEDGKTRIHSVSMPINATDEEHALFEASFGGMNIGNGGMYDNFAAYLETLLH